jgi:hypothetical protein
MSGKNGKAEVNVLICVPSFRGSVMSHTMVAISRTVYLLAKLGINSDVVNIDSAEITVARNTLASYALRQPHVTHLLFIDDDMTFEADAIVDLLRCDKPIIGYVCPKRILNQEKVYAATRAGATFDAAITAGLEFVHRHIPNATVTITEGMCPVRGIGMGVTLIKMSTFQTMIDKGVVNMPEPGTAENDAGFFAGPIIGFFDPLYSEDAGRFLSEDLSFCERWHLQCGGEVWAKVDRKIGHIGQYIFAGNYMDRLKTGTT